MLRSIQMSVAWRAGVFHSLLDLRHGIFRQPQKPRTRRGHERRIFVEQSRTPITVRVLTVLEMVGQTTDGVQVRGGTVAPLGAKLLHSGMRAGLWHSSRTPLSLPRNGRMQSQVSFIYPVSVNLRLIPKGAPLLISFTDPRATISQVIFVGRSLIF